jgi:hypothetical protein
MHYPPMRLWHRIMEQDKEQSLNESSHYRVTHVIKIFIRIHVETMTTKKKTDASLGWGTEQWRMKKEGGRSSLDVLSHSEPVE